MSILPFLVCFCVRFKQVIERMKPHFLKKNFQDRGRTGRALTLEWREWMETHNTDTISESCHSVNREEVVLPHWGSATPGLQSKKSCLLELHARTTTKTLAGNTQTEGKFKKWMKHGGKRMWGRKPDRKGIGNGRHVSSDQ